MQLSEIKGYSVNLRIKQTEDENYYFMMFFHISMILSILHCNVALIQKLEEPALQLQNRSGHTFLGCISDTEYVDEVNPAHCIEV